MVPGLSGLKNGALLKAAEEAGSDLFITADQEISYQQNLTGRRIALLILSTNNWGLVNANIAEIRVAIDGSRPGSFTFLDIGHARG